MRLAKSEALKKDIEILSQNHERDVDRKDAILQMLDRLVSKAYDVCPNRTWHVFIVSRRDLEEAEDQYQMALRLHLSNVDNLIKLHDGRLYVLERTFQQEVKKIQADFTEEKETMQAQFKREMKTLSAVIEMVEKEERERENEVLIVI